MKLYKEDNSTEQGQESKAEEEKLHIQSQIFFLHCNTRVRHI